MTFVGRWLDKFITWLTGPSFDEDVESVRLLTVRLCGFLPTASTVTNIIAVGSPALLTATAIASAICVAVSSRKSSMGLAELPVTVGGVVIEGDFVAAGVPANWGGAK